jgi:hypothetical protein
MVHLGLKHYKKPIICQVIAKEALQSGGMAYSQTLGVDFRNIEDGC